MIEPRKAFGTNKTSKTKIMLCTEGTYPFHQGGVSNWCNLLVNQMFDMDFYVYSVVMNPFLTQKFSLPKNSTLIKVPLWGTEDPSEHLDIPFSQVYNAKQITTQKIVQDHFIPLFINLIKEILCVHKSHLHFSRILLDMYKFFQTYDYKNSFKSELAWNLFKQTITEITGDPKNHLAQPSVFDLIQSLGWVYRFLTILNTPLPKVEVCHAAAAGFAGIPCILAKLDQGSSYLLTEHGVYLREQYLSLSRRGISTYARTFLIRFILSVVGASYALADQVSPVCHYNTRWETLFGVDPKKIEVIYNGVDKEIFAPPSEMQTSSHPTVVIIARIDPVKDLITMLKAAALVKQEMPEARFIVYGSVSVPAYYEECLSLREELGLKDIFIFSGHTDDPPAAYRSGDIVALSSITEAFPYTVVEAMMSGRPVVATDVGGVGEALGNCGLLVQPRNPEHMAQALLKLLQEPSLRISMGKEAREQALNYFTIERFTDLYRKSYQKLATKAVQTKGPSAALIKQKLLVERGYALLALGLHQEAINQFRMAIKVDTHSSAIPVLLVEIARAYNGLGLFDEAFVEMEKINALLELCESSLSA